MWKKILVVSLNEKFHGILIDLAKNEGLRRSVLALNNQTKRLSYRSLSEIGHLMSSLNYHKQIFDAIRERDNQSALALTEEHIINGMRVLLKMLPNKS